MVVEIMKNPEDFIMENMKADIAKAGNLFYQYRACRRDASIIYDKYRMIGEMLGFINALN